MNSQKNIINSKLLFAIKRWGWVVFFMVSSLQAQQPTQTLCFGSSANYAVDETENSGKGTLGSVYTWAVKGRGFVGKITFTYPDRTNAITIDWDATPVGEYELSVIEKDNAFVCPSSEKTVKITIFPAPYSGLKEKYFICLNPITQEIVRPAILDTGLSPNQYSFSWVKEVKKLPDTGASLVVTEVGNYRVVITDNTTGCSVVNITKVVLSSQSFATVRVDPIFEDSQNIVVTVHNGIGSYEYSIDSVTFQDSPTFTVTQSGVYTVIIRDKNGCNDQRLLVSAIFYPHYFTPNGDGVNDLWRIKGLLPDMDPVIHIHNRYDKLIKKLSINDPGWDGTFNGIDLPADDYWFQIEYTYEGQRGLFKSHFSLKR